MQIRKAEPKDYQEIRDVIIASFQNTAIGHNGEADLVESVRNNPTYRADLELIAKDNEHIVGHILLSEARVKNIEENKTTIGLNLAPISVLSQFQNQGIGHRLIEQAEKNASFNNYKFVSVLGEPEYFNPLGYESANKHEITSPLEIPSSSFMIKEIKRDGIKNVSGVLYYLEDFGQS